MNYYQRSAKKLNTITKILILSFFILAVGYLVQKFFQYWNFQSPILIQLRLPIKRIYLYQNARSIEPLPTTIPRKQDGKERQILPTLTPTPKPKASLTTDQTIADYIASKDWDYGTAIRIAKSENFWNFNKHFDCNRTNVNKDGSIDRGIFQINSVHTDISPEDAFDCFKNIDYAYNLWKRQGWQPWSAYTNLSYLGHDETIY